MHNNYMLGQDEGGEYTMSMAYLLGWQGPVWNPRIYGDGVSPDGQAQHVQEIQILSKVRRSNGLYIWREEFRVPFILPF